MSFLPLLIVVAFMVAVYFSLKWFKIADVRQIAVLVRKVGASLGVFGVAFAVTRNIGVAIFVAMLAYTYLSRSGWFAGSGRKSPGRISTVRTPYLEMSLDHDSGSMVGRVLQGSFAGRNLAEMALPDLYAFLAETRGADPQGTQLLEAYLDRVAPGWAESDAERASGSRTNGSSAAMSLSEAYLVLGLSPGATRDDVQAAHRNLMKRFHPDQGGSTYIASKLNEAKTVLLKNIAA